MLLTHELILMDLTSHSQNLGKVTFFDPFGAGLFEEAIDDDDDYSSWEPFTG
jgi:hypothetical protein